jgi:hypothetical protein
MQTVKNLFGSKKFVAMLGGVVIYAAGRFGLDMSQADADRILGMVALYLGVQGAADVGKEAAKAKGGPS